MDNFDPTPEPELSLAARTRIRVGWGFSGFVAAFMIFVSASGKFLSPAPPAVAEGAQKLGLSLENYPALGVLEIAVAVLSMLPPTSFIGTILVTGFLGGAVATHVRIGDAWGTLPAVLAVMAWVGWGLRHTDLIRAALRARG